MCEVKRKLSFRSSKHCTSTITCTIPQFHHWFPERKYLTSQTQRIHHSDWSLTIQCTWLLKKKILYSHRPERKWDWWHGKQYDPVASVEGISSGLAPSEGGKKKHWMKPNEIETNKFWWRGLKVQPFVEPRSMNLSFSYHMPLSLGMLIFLRPFASVHVTPSPPRLLSAVVSRNEI